MHSFFGIVKFVKMKSVQAFNHILKCPTKLFSTMWFYAWIELQTLTGIEIVLKNILKFEF